MIRKSIGTGGVIACHFNEHPGRPLLAVLPKFLSPAVLIAELCFAIGLLDSLAFSFAEDSCFKSVPIKTSNSEVDRSQADLIGIGAAVTRRPLPHHRAYGSVHGGSSWLR